MVVDQGLSRGVDAGRLGATLRWGGAGFVLAGLLQLVGGVPFAFGAAGLGIGSVWELLAWPIGGVVLLLASAVLAVGVRGEGGLVGPDPHRRAALIVAGAGPLLVVPVFLLSWSFLGVVSLLLAAVQLLVLVAAAIVAVTALRRKDVAGSVRVAFVVLAVVDAPALILAVLPTTTLAFQGVVAAVGPLVVLSAGVLLLLDGSSTRVALKARAEA